ncbi:MAG: hypothetical protein HFE73_08110 [Firmicutes bacterium]|jgi:hypothetical protein|nr:hypothetical protein [Bacillota bacterium]
MLIKRHIKTMFFIMAIALIIFGLFQINAHKDLNISYDYPVALNLEEMVGAADPVVVGKYLEFDSKWNMCREIGNIENEDTERYVEGHLYRFSVEDVLYGDIEDTIILVNHRFSESAKIEMGDGNVSEITVHDPLYIKPDLGQTYILFLNYNNEFGNYYGAIEPFSIKSSGDTVELQSNLIEKKGDFIETIRVSRFQTVDVKSCALEIEDTISGVSYMDIKSQIVKALKRP